MAVYSYLSKKYLKLFISVLLAIGFLTFLIDFIELIRRYGKKEIGLLKILQLSSLKQPPLLLEILPFIVLISGILFFVKLSENSEITILKSAGLSSKKIFVMPVIIIALLSIFEIAGLKSLAGHSQKMHNQIHNKLLNINPYNIAVKDIWFKEEEAKNGYIFNAKNITIKDAKLTFYDFTLIFLNNSSMHMITAKKALLENNILSLHGAKKTLANNQTQLQELYTIGNNLDPQFIKNKITLLPNTNISTSSIIELIDNIQTLEKAGISSLKLKALLSSYFIKPIFYIFLFLLAAYFCIFPPRYHKKILNIIITVSLGFFSFFLLNIFYTLASSGKMSILYGIWLPNLLLLTGIIYLLIKKELGHSLWT